jgi:phosphatidylserine/phosphatidylglycerophosphate/cardiolipin synthase-like enzyme
MIVPVLILLVLLLLLLPAPAGAQVPRLQEPEQSRPWAVYFSPSGGASRAVVEAIGRARKVVRIQAVTMSSPEITNALTDAHRRGVTVEVILDRKLAKGRHSSADALVRAGVVVLVDAAHPAANNNVIVIDDEVVLTGSFSFTPAADRANAENLLVIHASTLAARYGENWEAHAAHSVRYPGAP